MKRGQIIRRMLNNGTPVGAYMVIKDFVSGHVVAQRIGIVVRNNGALYYAKNHVYTPSICRFPVEHDIWERINSGRQIALIHDETSLWSKMLKTKPELVEIRSSKYPQKRITFVVDNICEWWCNRTRQVRLTLGTKII